MEPHEIHTLLNDKMGEMLVAMNEGNMILAMELREDLVSLLMIDREKASVDCLKQVKKKPADVDAKISEATAKIENLEGNLKHDKGKN
jgi:hypothetical protein